ncbi:MAG: hypothetical protein E6330_08215 [Dialister sp.]|nr:hypothetical protein [Dialister sp.]
MVADGNAAITAVIALPQGSSCQSRTSDGNAVLSFREGTIAECHGVRTECPVVIDVGPVFVGIAFQIIAGRFIIIGTHAKIPERQSLLLHLLADFARNVGSGLNTKCNCPGNGLDPACHAGNFTAVDNLVKQISGDFVLDFLFFLWCQRLYICHAARQKRRHDKSGKQAVFDAGFILPVSFRQLGSDNPAIFCLAPNQLVNFIHRAS